MTTKELASPFAPAPLKPLVARALRLGSHCLARLARRLGATGRQPAPELPLFEFHAEAGAPEGALYVNGRFVGHLPGVTRL